MENKTELSTPRGKKVFWLLAVLGTGIALCAVMKTFFSEETGDCCKC